MVHRFKFGFSVFIISDKIEPVNGRARHHISQLGGGRKKLLHIHFYGSSVFSFAYKNHAAPLPRRLSENEHDARLMFANKWFAQMSFSIHTRFVRSIDWWRGK